MFINFTKMHKNDWFCKIKIVAFRFFFYNVCMNFHPIWLRVEFNAFSFSFVKNYFSSFFEERGTKIFMFFLYYLQLHIIFRSF